MVRVRAPQFPQNLVWLNSAALSIASLRGQPILLDFWTYGCINCLHVLPQLHHLAEKYYQQVTFIGVHTAKFAAENAIAGIQGAIDRYNIRHPVVVDHDRHIWDAYAVRAYPTFVLIDAQGYIVLTAIGEGQLDRIESALQALVDSKAATAIATPPSPVPHLESLRFPGKVLADRASDRLFIADSGHHRIVVTDFLGQTSQSIGQGQAGFQDGDGDRAQFANPQGLALDPSGKALYVADTGNHAVRKIDLNTYQITTIAGTGVQSPWLYPHGGLAQAVALNSPWDLLWHDRVLWVAMAGSHQIWCLDLTTGHLQTWAGTGAEGCFDGVVERAAFAQPSGLATDGRSLFVADCESSTVRAITLVEEPIVRSICGSGNLYNFGDRDGQGEGVRLQHCLGLAYDPSGNQPDLWVADTYNHKIKRINLATGQCETMFADFAEPAGLAIAHNWLFVADTNHHRIVRLDRQTGDRFVLPFSDLCPPGICRF
ncbi:thioredoxin-like domain-containing protein [Alkalinema pantanalense CENA528]|uniref:thioredoxin-like domain-containing protein n=1 Tax=Alkalinema pantanalense TaxID=1620705 RepID=UPI003D6F1525